VIFVLAIKGTVHLLPLLPSFPGTGKRPEGGRVL